MKITLNETQTGTILELEVYKVDTPTGEGWSVLTPQGRKVVIKFRDGNWHAEDDHSITQEFWQMVGEEISRTLDENLLATIGPPSNPRPKRTRILKYLMV
ncbi:hypothetical protein BDD43_4981 [Mucilaginibacter gracilis]|uniref:Uncharacterized protein n=2 Tax=Mucilaginibacter TaxID=423349 RepID=H1Y634_9SPHI|nr:MULTISPECIES: hypothetical protein [Mucilaginibacter]EHQ30993.1 hypothetical protein Mucpa_6945 [Mucilaginibacter paludis DSM 18603]RKR84730.1 hypothetical protein BDD43_4981 [Mucilaginibacter gracilis]